jgi:hypothetical protein
MSPRTAGDGSLTFRAGAVLTEDIREIEMTSSSASIQGKRVSVLNPRGTPPPVELIPLAPRLDTLTGKTIYIVDVNFQDTENFYVAARELLSEKYPSTNWVVKTKQGSFFDEDPSFWADVKEKADGAIVGPGHLDTLGPAVVGWCAKLEKMGVPAVPLICAMFPDMERQTAVQKGIPRMRIAYLAYHVIGVSVEDSRENLEADDPVTGVPVLAEIIGGLTKPVSAEEAKTGILERPVPRLLEPDTPADLQRYFIDNGWTDYLPVVLPTEERVAAMLKGTSHKPDEVVGKMAPCAPQEAWTYTVEQVAVNAVMAGARPEHFPVILAIASTGQTSLWSSVTSQTRMAVINGPIRRELNMNSGIGALGPFNEANAVIGRCWTLISKNLGNGGAVGSTYLGVQGNALNYSNLLFPEDEEGLPRGWQPLHVEKGFKPEESVVSIFAGFSLINDGHLKPRPFHRAVKQQLLKIEPFFFYKGVSFGLRATLLASSAALDVLVDEGFKTKQSFKQWLGENLYKPEGDAPALHPADTPVNVEIVAVGERKLPVCQAGEIYYATSTSVDEWK